MRVTAIVPAAGRGVRLKRHLPKPLILLKNRPILIHTLKALEAHHAIFKIIVLTNKDSLGIVRKKVRDYRLKKVKDVLIGGHTRCESVQIGLKNLDYQSDIVLIHDGVRPFVTYKIISQVIKAAAEFGAAVVGVPVKSTLKSIDNRDLSVEKTLLRSCLWEIQTPQAFKREIIIRAYETFPDRFSPDDACLVERLGHKVKLVRGAYFNIKITTPEDLVFAEAILNHQLKRR